MLFALVAGSTEPANYGLATVVIVDLWILPRMKINIMKKKLGPISVVLYCYSVPCVRQFTSKRGRGSIMATCCQGFAIEEPPAKHHPHLARCHTHSARSHPHSARSHPRLRTHVSNTQEKSQRNASSNRWQRPCIEDESSQKELRSHCLAMYLYKLMCAGGEGGCSGGSVTVLMRKQGLQTSVYRVHISPKVDLYA